MFRLRRLGPPRQWLGRAIQDAPKRHASSPFSSSGTSAPPPSSSSSSPRRQNALGRTAAPLLDKVFQDDRAKFRIPTKTRNLLVFRDFEPTHPPAYKCALFSRRMGLAGASDQLNGVEAFLLKINRNLPDGQMVPKFHEAKRLTLEWEKVKHDLGQIDAKMKVIYGFERVFQAFWRRSRQREWLECFPHRVHFFSSAFLFCRVIDDSIGMPVDSDLLLEQILRICCQTPESESTLRVLLLSALAKSKSPSHLALARKIATEYSRTVMPEIVKDLHYYANEYLEPEKEGVAVVTLYPHTPSAFVPGEIENAGERFVDIFGQVEPKYTIALHSVQAIAMWRAGRFSEALKHLESSSILFATNFSSDEVRVGSAVIYLDALKSVVSATVTEDMRPSLECLSLLCTELAKMHPKPLFIYAFWSFLEKSQNQHHIEVARDLALRYPVEKMRKEYPDLEIIVDNPQKMILIEKFFKEVFNQETEPMNAHETFNPTDSEVEKRADNDLDVDISPEMKVNMLEIRVLELLSENKVDEAVEFVGVSHDIEKVFLSEEILDALLTKIDPVTQHELMTILKTTAPLQSDLANKVFSYECSKLLTHNYRHAWKKDRLAEATSTVLEVYESLLMDENHLRFEDLDALLRKVNNYLVLFLEESQAMEKESKVLETVELAGMKLAKTYNAYSVLVQLWESLFFSPKFTLNQQGDNLIETLPQIARNIDVDRILGRAIRYQDEKFFRNLVEFVLKYDLEDYEKTRAFEGLLVFQCQRGDLVAAKACIESAQKLDVGIGADAMNIYVKASQRERDEKAAGILSNIKDFFKGGH